jgi:S1-C subfamily serine protease
MSKSLLVLVILLTGFAGGLASSRILSMEREQASPADASRAAALVAEPPASAQRLGAAGQLPDLTAVAERAILASVNIASTQRVPVDPFFRLFGGYEPYRTLPSLGSGVIVSADGYVLTNNHVLGDPRRGRADIRVTLSDNRELPAEIIGADPFSDLAVLKVEATGLSPLPWGRSDRLRVAEWVLAIGNPFAFNQTVTLGIVSAVNRINPQLNAMTEMIQTDAAINPGNSGGALVNIRGELVGINNRIISETGGYQGLGFAIPSNVAREVMEQIQKDGQVTRGDIGLYQITTLDPSAAERAGLGRIRGVIVRNFWRNSPVHRAGLEISDIIVSFNGEDIGDVTRLQQLVGAARVGTSARLGVLRDGRRLELTVAIEPMTNRR